jgi:hypothetical protein
MNGATRSRPLTTLLGLGLAAALPACQDEVDYGYFSVKVVVDQTADTDYLARIATCGVNVDGADADFSSLACAEGRFTRHELGTFEWSTDTSNGSVQFTVTLKDSTWAILGTGTSDPAPIEPGRTVETRVLVKPAPGTLTPPQ